MGLVYCMDLFALMARGSGPGAASDGELEVRKSWADLLKPRS